MGKIKSFDKESLDDVQQYITANCFAREIVMLEDAMGETNELYIEDVLNNMYRFDEICAMVALATDLGIYKVLEREYYTFATIKRLKL